MKKYKKLKRELLQVAIALDEVSEELAGTDRGVDRLNERISALENNVFTEAGFNRITEASKRITAETERINQIRDTYVTEAGFEDLIARVRKLEANATALPTYTPRVDEAMFGEKPTVGYDDSLNMAEVEPEPQYSPPIGAVLNLMGGQIQIPDETVARIQYDALAEAVARVQSYMDGSFSAGTIRGVVEAIVRDSTPKPATFDCCGLEFKTPHARSRHQTEHHPFEGREASGFCEKDGCGKDPRDSVHR